MKKETIAYAKRDISKVVRMTEDEKLVSSIWSFINGYFSKQPQELDPRNQVENLGPEFWDSRESEVNMYNVKDKLIENIERISEDYVSNLQYLHKIYCLTKAYLKSENCNQ